MSDSRSLLRWLEHPVARASLWGLCTLSCTLPAAGQQATSTPAGDQTSTLEEVVVTATKRNEKLQDTPVAMSVLSSQTIDRLNANGFQDYASLVPSLNQAQGSGIGGGTIVLRGLNTGPQSLTSTTAVYIDETPVTGNGSYSISALATPDPDLMDIERIEVLYGPQGTLYGASSLGGLIRIIPQQPDVNATELHGDFRVDGSVAQGGDTGYGVRGSLSDAVVPGKLAISVTGFDRRDPGFITNVTTGNDKIGQADVDGGTLSAVWQPTDNLSVRGFTLYEDGRQTGLIYQEDISGTDIPLYGPRKYAAGFDGAQSPRYELYELVVNYTTPLGTLTAVGSRSYTRLHEDQDVTSSYGVLLTADYPLLTGQPPPTGAYVAEPSNIVTSAANGEVRFASRRLGAFEFLLGGFYTDQQNSYVDDLLGFQASGQPLPAPFYNVVTTDTRTAYRETAEFGDLTYYIFDNLDVTGGLRYTSNDQSGLVLGNGLLFGPAGQDTPLNSADHKTLWQTNLRYRPTKDVSTYFRVATGYRPGGPQNNPLATTKTFGPDTVTDYELGAKGTGFDHRLMLDGSIYRIDWQNVQLNTLLGGVVFVGNAAAARAQGAELQFQWQANSALNLGGSAGYNDAKLTEIGNTTALAIGAKVGDRLPNSPKVTAAAYGDYNIPLTPAVTASVGATLRYQGDQVSSFSGDTLDVFHQFPGYATLDLRSSLTWDRYAVRATVSNITDKNGYTGYVTNNILPDQGSPPQVFLTRPRTFMLSIEMDF